MRLVTEQGYTFIAAAKAVGVSSRSLRDWYKRLRNQLQRAELEREILKKATAYFAKESL